MLWIFLGILFASLALGLPIAFGLGVAAVVMAVLSDIPLSILIEQSIRGVNSFPLLAIPFFILVGEVMSHGGIARRLMDLAGALVGFVMDLTPAMVIMAPMLTPIVTSVGVDPVYFGVLMAFILGIGLLTPPVGTCLYVGCGVGKVSMEALVRAMLPYYATLLVVLVILIAFPGIVTWLPDLAAVRGN
ncbi:TRAP transporter large permease subunit [Halomonas sp. 3H]|uniref:TRAP transporter large permease subunit n=1 Tax=Halomonas sp. 3H TaxID=2952527 RepID=UPI0020B6F28F|nr:TRAP transporter large permease subunit [Halomonas sp. 3H]